MKRGQTENRICKMPTLRAIVDVDVRGPKRPYINFGELVCRRVAVSASWIVGELSSYRNTIVVGNVCRWFVYA